MPCHWASILWPCLSLQVRQSDGSVVGFDSVGFDSGGQKSWGVVVGELPLSFDGTIGFGSSVVSVFVGDAVSVFAGGSGWVGTVGTAGERGGLSVGVWAGTVFII